MKIRMKMFAIAAVIGFSIPGSGLSFGAPGKFEKVSDHCYYLQLKDGENLAVISTDEGVLVVDPPSEPDLGGLLDALKKLTSKPVRWVILSNPRSARSAGVRFFAEQGAVLIAGAQLRAVLTAKTGNGTSAPDGDSVDLSAYPWLVFDHQLHLFPSDLEVRIMALDQKARTGGDVILHVPAEKALLVGNLFEAARYPEIDTAVQGDACTWAEGLKEVADSVPVLKSAIPAKTLPAAKPAVVPKPAAQPGSANPQLKPESAGTKEPEVTLEEGIAVVSARGDVSNLQNMKDLLSACQRLRADITKAVKSGRSCESFLSSSRANIYRVYGNFDSYASQLCQGIASSTDKP